MYRAYLAAVAQYYLNRLNSKFNNKLWKLKRFVIHWQLGNIQKSGIFPEIFGPLIINNRGYIEIGDRVIVNSKLFKPVEFNLVNENSRLIIEDDVFINYGVEISLKNKIVIGSKSLIGNESLIYDTDWHTLDGSDDDAPAIPTTIGKGVWLGARVVVLKGVTIGNNSVIAANSTVTRDIPDCVLAGGNPAKVIKRIVRNRF